MGSTFGCMQKFGIEHFRQTENIQKAIQSKPHEFYKNLLDNILEKMTPQGEGWTSGDVEAIGTVPFWLWRKHLGTCSQSRKWRDILHFYSKQQSSVLFCTWFTLLFNCKTLTVSFLYFYLVLYLNLYSL